MNKIVDRISVHINFFLVISLVVLFFRNYICRHVSDYQYNIILWVTIIPLLFIYIYKIINHKIKFNKYDILIFLFLFCLMLATIFSSHFRISVLGYPRRMEGFISYIAYCLLFLNAKSLATEKSFFQFLKVFTIVGLMQFAYCVFQVFFRFGFMKIFILDGVEYMASGFIGNPNFLAAFVMILLCIYTALWLFKYKNSKLNFILTLVFFINLIFAQSTGPFFAYIFILIFIIIFLIVKKKIEWKRILILLGTLFMSFIIVSNLIEICEKNIYGGTIVKSYTIKGDIENTFRLLIPSKSGNESENITITNYGSGRLTIWKNTMKIVPKYFWVGSGPDTFGYVYPNQFQLAYYDKAHNEYLQMLVTTGIFTLVAYLILLMNLFIDGVMSNSKLVWILLIGFLGYALQAFMNISVINVAPFYYIIIGFLSGLVSKQKVKEKV